MAEIVNILAALLSIGIGAISWVNPTFTLAALDLSEGDSTMGRSELRASAGALFVAIGLGAWLLGTPSGWLMLGIAWAGAAVGRITSILLDPRPTQRTWGFFACEALVGGAVIAVNL